MAVKPEHIKRLQGRDFVLYAGLIELAHEIGLTAIETSVVQLPSDANGQTTVVQASVTLADGRRFSGIGDANPANVGKAIAVHAIRMAETRAKARALRDATNVGLTAWEELAEDEKAELRRSKPPVDDDADRAYQDRRVWEVCRRRVGEDQPLEKIKAFRLEALGRPSSAGMSAAELRAVADRIESEMAGVA